MLSCFLHPESPQGTTSGPMASWLATFIVYQSVRQHFSSARTNFHHFSNIKIFASLVFFRTFVSFSFFKKLYSSSLSTVQWKFYLLHFLYWFSLKFIRVFPLYFSEQLKKEIERKKDQFKSAWRDIPLYADWRKEEFQTVNLTLDAATAHPALFLSEEGRRSNLARTMSRSSHLPREICFHSLCAWSAACQLREILLGGGGSECTFLGPGSL
nr:uncharacterized protein LOC112579993 isoform X1 [Bubalus bubalis]